VIWKEKRILLIVLALLLAANAAFFFTYRVQYESRLKDLETKREEATRSLKAARSSRTTAQQQVAAVARIQKDVEQVYDQRWSTQQKRLAPMIIEVKRLANASDFQPQSYSFTRVDPSVTDRKTAKNGAGATAVKISFSVEGKYEQVRRLINLLELSDQFVIIDQISLNATAGNMLTLTLDIKTLFRDDLPEPAGRRS
jgi:Tfp pilus assembly protein PilO